MFTKVLRDMQELVPGIRKLAEHDPVRVDYGSSQLRLMRSSIAEDEGVNFPARIAIPLKNRGMLAEFFDSGFHTSFL